jgi:hypothetical protein
MQNGKPRQDEKVSEKRHKLFVLMDCEIDFNPIGDIKMKAV